MLEGGRGTKHEDTKSTKAHEEIFEGGGGVYFILRTFWLARPGLIAYILLD
jgi:hypothetical protein